MYTLEEEHPGLHVEFIHGNYVGQKSQKAFSKLGFDQKDEELVAILKLKGDCGIIGVTENANALRRLLVASPKLSQ